MGVPAEMAATEGESRGVHVAFRNVSKSYDKRSRAVADLDLDIREGEFLTLLGPSGSGKTTTLMMLAGFEQPDSGSIVLRGESLSRKPPHRRNIGVVFQNYALFPHMTVAGNLAFPLRVRGIRGKAAEDRVRSILNLVHLGELADRRPSTLSGGQQQRVALARALIFEPDIVLMDEPLGALDRQLRETLQVEIKRIHREFGVTLVYVTHDQSEALMLSDRVAVFAGGRLQQLSDPRTIYDNPASAFVAGFIGDNNVIPGDVMDVSAAHCTVRTAGGLPIRAAHKGRIMPGDRVRMAIRPQQITMGPEARRLDNCFDARVYQQDYHGDHGRIRVLLPGDTEVTVRGPGGALQASPLVIGWPADLCLAFADTEDPQ